jgi:peptide deformylase
MDHLIGKVFLDRMTDLSTLTQLPEFSQYWQKEPSTVI